MNNRSDAEAATAKLLDGRVVSLRRLCRHDTKAVLELHEKLPADDCYLRFFAMRPIHLERLVHQLTTPTRTCCAIGAFDADRLTGVAYYVVDRNDPQSAEVAITVAHDDHRVGVGTALLERLADVANAHGVTRFTAYVLATNHLMLHLLSDIGWPHKRLDDDGSVLHFEIDPPRHTATAHG